MSKNAVTEREETEGEEDSGTQLEQPNRTISEVPSPEGLKEEPAANPPTGTGGVNGARTNQDAPLVDEVAEGGGLEVHPFWLLLKRVGYTEW